MGDQHKHNIWKHPAFLINYVYTITCTITIQLQVIYRTAPLIRKLTSVFLCRKECFASASRPEPQELLQWRSGTQIASLCRRRQVFHSDNYQPRIPRAPFLCGCCYSAPQYGGLGEDFESCLATCTQYRQWARELNILHRWKWSTSVCNSLYTLGFLEHQSRPHEERCQKSSWWRHSPKYGGDKRRIVTSFGYNRRKDKSTNDDSILYQIKDLNLENLPLLNRCLCHRLIYSMRTLSSS